LSIGTISRLSFYSSVIDDLDEVETQLQPIEIKKEEEPELPLAALVSLQNIINEDKQDPVAPISIFEAQKDDPVVELTTVQDILDDFSPTATVSNPIQVDLSVDLQDKDAGETAPEPLKYEETATLDYLSVTHEANLNENGHDTEVADYKHNAKERFLLKRGWEHVHGSPQWKLLDKKFKVLRRLAPNMEDAYKHQLILETSVKKSTKRA